MKITVIGAGYVGLVSGVCLASKGHQVICVDVRKEIVNCLNSGTPHIFENHLENLLQTVVNDKLFSATTDLNRALENSDLVLIAVGTPSLNGKIDLGQMKMVSNQIGKFLRKSDKFLAIVVKSTVVPSTTDSLIKDIIESESEKKLGDFGLGMNPEFLREGNAIDDFMNPDRIVIGFEDFRTKNLLNQLYDNWNCQKLFVNSRTAEMIKYANNTLLACLISMNNELSNLSSTVGDIDYLDVIDGISSDNRWSPTINNEKIYPSIISYFTPGAGFGGSCFPKDVQAIRTLGESLGLNMNMSNSILNVNDNQPDVALRKIENSPLASKSVLFLGLSFKPNTDDIRESSSIKILNLLLSRDYNIIAHDPIAVKNTKKEVQNTRLKFTVDWKSEIKNNDIVIIGTNWEEYKKLTSILGEEKSKKLIIDCKRLLDSSEIKYHHYSTYGK